MGHSEARRAEESQSIRFFAALRMTMSLAVCMFCSLNLFANEVNVENQTSVVVHEHPQTGRPYLCIVKAGTPPRKIFYGPRKKFKKPNYRLLDPHVSPKEAGYDGPSSDRTKIYVLAGALAAGGVAAYAALPVSATAGLPAGSLAGGAALYAGAGAAVTTGTLSLHWAMTQTDRPDDFTHRSVSKSLSFWAP